MLLGCLPPREMLEASKESWIETRLVAAYLHLSSGLVPNSLYVIEERSVKQFCIIPALELYPEEILAAARFSVCPVDQEAVGMDLKEVTFGSSGGHV